MENDLPKIVIAACAFALLASGAQAQTTAATPMDHTHMDHAAHMQMMEQMQHQAAVADRGKEVMPFDLAATTHFFSKTAQGGVQQVVAQQATDTRQVQSARSHLREIRAQFLKGDYSGPAHIHGQDMPGLSELQAARPGQIAIDYKDIRGGGQLTYKTANANLVTALHQWFDAQLMDHGKDAMEGHAHHGAMTQR